MDWYFSKDGESQGPVDAGEIKRMLSEGEISPDTMVSKADADTNWIPASDADLDATPPIDDPAFKKTLTVARRNSDDPSKTASISKGDVEYSSIKVSDARARGLKRQHLAHVQSFWANTFCVIAILAIIDSQLYHFGLRTPEALGLGMVEIAHGFAKHTLPLKFESAYTIGMLAAQLLAPIMLFLIGVLARTNHLVYLLGLVLYAVDTGIHLLEQNWIAVGVHVAFSAVLIHGYIASLRRLKT